MLTKLVISAAVLTGIILAIFWIANWMGQRIVNVPRETFLESLSPVLGMLVVATYFTLALAAIVLLFKYFPWGIRVLIVVVFTAVTYHFFLFLFDVTGLGTRRLLAVSFGCAITLLWTMYPNWATLNLAATLTGITMLILLGAIPLRVLAIVAVGVTLYDVVAVFGTGQMIEAARGARGWSLPMMFVVPESFDLSSRPANMLGLGDVVIPGALIMAAVKKNIRHAWSWTLLGYFIGLLVAMSAVYLTRFLQPATIYLVPGVLLGLVWAAYRSGMLKETFAPEK